MMVPQQKRSVILRFGEDFALQTMASGGTAEYRSQAQGEQQPMQDFHPPEGAIGPVGGSKPPVEEQRFDHEQHRREYQPQAQHRMQPPKARPREIGP
jgi:hypothetical protein